MERAFVTRIEEKKSTMFMGEWLLENNFYFFVIVLIRNSLRSMDFAEMQEEKKDV